MKEQMKLLPAASGTCVMCACKHSENEPHNYWSLFYQIRFRMKYNRDATHADSIAHLNPVYRTRGIDAKRVLNMGQMAREFNNIVIAYKEILRKHGMQWLSPEGDPIAEPYAESD